MTYDELIQILLWPWWAVILWTAFMIRGPIRRFTKVRFQHNALFVWAAAEARNGNHRPSVMVQENGEWRLGKVLAILAGCVFAYFGVWSIANLLFMVIVDQLVRIIPFFDTAGHGAEIIAAEKAGVPDYRTGEMERMQWSRPGMTLEEIDQSLRRWHWLAVITYWLGSR